MGVGRGRIENSNLLVSPVVVCPGGAVVKVSVGGSVTLVVISSENGTCSSQIIIYYYMYTQYIQNMELHAVNLISLYLLN